jgi:hypothetical protein
MLRLVVATSLVEEGHGDLLLVRPTTPWLKERVTRCTQVVLADSHHPHMRPERVVFLTSCIEREDGTMELRFATAPQVVHYEFLPTLLLSVPPPKEEEKDSSEVYEGMAARAVAAGKRRLALSKKAKMQERMAAVRAAKHHDEDDD